MWPLEGLFLDIINTYPSDSSKRADIPSASDQFTGPLMHARAACHQTSSSCVATILVHALGSSCLAASSLLARAALPTNQATPGSARQRRHIDGEAAAHRRRSSTRDRAGTARQQRRRPGCAPSMRQLIIRRAYALYLYPTTRTYPT